MSTKKSPKIARFFECQKCNYNTSKKYDYDKHILTDKHKNSEIVNIFNEKSTEKSPEKLFTCEICYKKYKERSGLWRHKKKCNGTSICDNSSIYDNNDFENNIEQHIKLTDITDKELIIMLIKEISSFKNLTYEQNNNLLKVIENGTHNTNNVSNSINSNNKSFNLQFFLNETCKDAMNLMDFVNSINISFDEFEKVGQLGYVEGLSNIIVKNLNNLDITKRPIHCTDAKREILYVKDNGIWEKDDNKNNIRKMIKYVAHKNAKMLFNFKEKYPDCGQSKSKYSDQYNKLLIEVMGGSGNNDLDKENKIIKNITKRVIIEK